MKTKPKDMASLMVTFPHINVTYHMLEQVLGNTSFASQT